MKRKTYVGVLEKTPNGNGFVKIDDKKYFVSKFDMKNAMAGDTVKIEPVPEHFWHGDSPEAMVLRVVERNRLDFIGRLVRLGKHGIFINENQIFCEDIFVSAKHMGSARFGDVVRLEITKFPKAGKMAEGRVSEILASRSDPYKRLKSMVLSKGLSFEYPSEAENYAKDKADEFLEELDGNALTDEYFDDRMDLRDKLIFTIDGEDSMDLDDAISMDKLPNGNYQLGVHIADVSEFVKEGSSLDNEALKRGTSIYLINKVIPMLPNCLSSGVCSLFEGVDRLTLSAILEIDGNGEIQSTKVVKSVINSKGRLYYNSVSDVIEGKVKEKDWEKEEYRILLPLKDKLLEMEELAQILRRRREKEGSIDFEIPESKIVLNEKGRPIFVGQAERRSGHKLIEEFMLAANKGVAEHFFWRDIPFVYRVHQKPEADKLKEFKAMLISMGLNINGRLDAIHPSQISKVLEKAKGSQYEGVISNIALRTMQKAYYDTNCLGHFGLAFKYYCHFTSPIRRYPDLMIHRLIKADMDGKITENNIRHFEEDAQNAAETSSKKERQAIELERDYDKVKKAEYMKDKVGEYYNGIVSGIISRGIFVELSNTVEGLINFSTIKNDYYYFSQQDFAAIGTNSRRKYTFGDEVTVKVVNVDLERGLVEFKLVQ